MGILARLRLAKIRTMARPNSPDMPPKRTKKAQLGINIEHGAVITSVYRTSDYQPTKIFTWFVEQVTEARRAGDVEKSKALLAEVFKLLGNSRYGKLIEALERQTNIIYTNDEKVVDRALRSAYFSDLDEIGQAYELESRKPRITIRRPFQVGIAVYQLAKLRMLEFYHDFLDRWTQTAIT